jgi:AbiTii-like protein
MSAAVEHLEERLKDGNELLEEIMPSAITLAMMLRQRTMAAWMRTEFDGYGDPSDLPPYRRDIVGHIVARSPQYGWIPAPMDDSQKQEIGRRNMVEGVKSLEKTCLKCKKGTGNRIVFDKEEMARIQSEINLSAELAITVSRDSYGKLLRVVRSALYLWCQDLMAAGIGGEHNSYSAEERQSAAHLDNPELFWRRALENNGDLPIPDVREVGFFDRFFGRAS